MSLLAIIFILVIVGIVLYLINRYVPMDQPIKTIVNLLVVVLVIFWLLQVSGILGSFGSVRV